ncbi:MAG: methyltransferase domain-containing protein [Streptosporangiaceae bacterium]
MDSAELSALRDRMVTQVINGGRTVSDAVVQALRAVPRHLFLPELGPEQAYRNEAIVTRRSAEGHPTSSSSQPTIMAYMLDQLRVIPGQRVLEIGAGTGYNAALLQYLVGAQGTVVTVDLDAEVARQAAAHLTEAGYPGVTVIPGDGAAGYPPGAPYDRVIATVGVSDLAPAWLDQLVPGGRIVVPLDLRGSQRSVAFERDGASWQSRSVVPCGFMRMRGMLAGPERTQVTHDDRELALTIPGGRDVDIIAVARALAEPTGPAAEHATCVTAGPAQLFDGLGFWLALNEPRWGLLSESVHASQGELARAPLLMANRRITAGIFGDSGFAVLARPTPLPVADELPAAGDPPGPGGSPGGGGSPGAGGSRKARRGQLAAAPVFQLSVLGYGAAGPDLAAELASAIQAWAAAGRPGAGNFRISAYPRAGGEPVVPGAAIIERPHTTFVVRPV